MTKSKKNVADDFQELANSILDLSDLIAQCNVPDCITSQLVQILNKVTEIYTFCLDEKEVADKKILEYQKVNIELSGYIDQLLTELEVLQKFVDAAQKFPGFQC